MALTIRDAVRKYGQEYLAICGLAKYFPTMNSQSHVFFVDGTSTVGNDSAANQGQTPDTPLLTITKALSLVTDGANDYVFILDYPSTAPSTEVFPLLIDKQRTHVIGLQNGLLPRFKICSPSAATATDKAVFSICANTTTLTYGSYSEIANLVMGNKWTSSLRGTIECNYGGVFGIHIHHCHFGLTERSSTGGAYGILVGKSYIGDSAGELMHSLIEHCRFGTLLTEGGINIPVKPWSASNPVKGTIIRNNHFHVNSGDRGINVADTTADFGDGGIFNNTFECDGDAADGEAVYFASGAKGSVHDNAAWTDDGVIMANNPFFDAGSTNMSFGRNFRGPGEVTALSTEGTVKAEALATPTNI